MTAVTSDQKRLRVERRYASLSANRGSLALLTGGLGFFARPFFALVIVSM
jgi:hypothetical protein